MKKTPVNFDYPDSYKSKKITIYNLDIPLYQCSVDIAVGEKARQIEKLWGNKPLKSGGQARDYMSNCYCMVSLYADKPDISTVAHEFIHVCNFIFKSRGLKLDVDNDEAFAYLHTYLMDEYIKYAKKHKFISY